MKKAIVSLILLFGLTFSPYADSQVLLNNVCSYNGTMGANDYYSAIISDNSDNVYAAGYSTDDVSAFIIFDKYNSAGTKIWSKIYRSINNGYDVPVSIAIDSTGGIYIAGYTKGLTTSYDFLLVKYNLQGDTIWSRRYNGSMNGDDRAIKVAVDRNNSVVIAGNAYETGGGKEIVLVKYDANGNQIWKKVYTGISNYDDTIYDFAFDKNNFIYTASQNNYSAYSIGRFHVKKINTTGDTVWTRTIASEAGFAKAIIVDDSLNVYATGMYQSGQDTSSFYTAKFNSGGNLLWSSTFFIHPLHRDNAYRISFDEIGNLYVAGELNSIVIDGLLTSSFGYAVLKYSPGGQMLWAFDIPYSFPLNPICHLKVVNSSNIYLAYNIRSSYDYRFYSKCLKLNANGDTSWVKSVQGQYLFSGMNSFNVDKSGNLLFGSAAYGPYDQEAALLKYSSSGNMLWGSYFNSIGFSSDNAISMGKDYQNNIYITGINAMNYVFLKYNSSFIQQWAVTYSDGSSRNEQFSFSVNDSLGNVYLAGTTKDSTNNYYVILLKYNSSGNLVWERKYTNYYGLPWAICLDKTGNVIVVSTNLDNSNHSTMKILKYNPSGTLLLSTSYNTQYNSPIRVYSADTDNDNNILIAGCADGATTWKYTSAGNLVWVRNWTGTYVHQNNKLKYDKRNNVYVCGFTGTGSPQGYNYLTIKYDSSGNQKWVKTFSGIRNGEDFALDLVNDTLGNTYVTGYTQNNPVNTGISTVSFKYDSIGNTIWQREIRTPQNGDVRPVMLNLDKYNNVYILCYSNYNQPYNGGYQLVKYNSNGDSIWNYMYSSPYFKNYGKSFLSINEDKIYITGKAYGVNSGYDITTIELIHITGIIKTTENIPTLFSLSQNYPNPFNPVTKIKFDVPSIGQSMVTLKIFDIMGREVQTLVDERLQPGTYETTFDGSNLSSGVYFYQMISGSYKETKKLLLLK